MSIKKIPPFLILLFFSLFAYANAQERNVLIEYCAGTWCGSCPLAAITVEDDILPNYPSTIVLAYHGWYGSSDPFSDFEGHEIIDLLSFNSYPTGRIDRATDALPDYHWLENVESRSEVSPKVNIACEVSFDSLLRKATVNIESIPILDDLKEDCNLTVILVEDGIVAPQQIAGDSLVQNDYVHNNVVRKVVSSVLGDDLNSGMVWEVGNPIEKEYLIDISSDYNFRNCKVVSFVHYNEKELYRGEILQAISTKIFEEPSGVTGEEDNLIDGFQLFQNYPNPFGKGLGTGNSTTKIKFVIPEKFSTAYVILSIYDVLGRKVGEPINGFKQAGVYETTFNAKSLSAGVYFYVLNIYGKSNRLIYSSTKKMLLLSK